MERPLPLGSNMEQGSVLIVALVILVLLTLLGIAASTTTTIELQIAGNDKTYKMAFFAADGGTELGAELLEQNIEKRAFTTATVGSVTVSNNDFWSQMAEPAANDATVMVANSQVGLRIYGNAELSTGGAIQLISGYEGKGKGAGGSGAYLVHDIRSRATGPGAADARVHVRWRHMIGG